MTAGQGGETPAGGGNLAAALRRLARRPATPKARGRAIPDLAQTSGLADLDLTRTPHWFRLTRTAFERQDQAPAFLDLLLAHPGRSLASLRGIATTAALAASQGRTEAFHATLDAWTAGPGAGPAGFFCIDHLLTLRAEVEAATLALLVRRKHGGFANAPAAGLCAGAARLAPAVLVEADLEDLLFAHRTDTATDRATWTAGLRFGIAADHLACDMDFIDPPRRGQPHAWISAEILAGTAAARQAFAPGDGRRGRLLATFHGGQLGMVRHLFRTVFTEGVTLGMGERQMQAGAGDADGAFRRISLRDDPKAALFATLRQLQDGRVVLMAPDGPIGQSRLPVRILGRDFDIGEGGAFLAWEAGCANAFFTYRFDGQGYVPHIVPGPEPRAGEKYRDFRDRWAAFYAGEVEAIFTGRPETIAFRRNWLAKLLRPQGDPGAARGAAAG